MAGLSGPRQWFALLLVGNIACGWPEGRQFVPPVAARSRSETAAPPRSTSAGEIVRLGEVSLSVSTSRTAAVFHAVDQLSLWSPFCHPQYAKWAPLPRDTRDQILLDRHAAIRKRVGRDNGIESAMYLSAESPRSAVANAVQSGILSREEGADETAILEAWDARLADHLATPSGDVLREKLIHESSAFANLVHHWLAIADLPPPDAPIPLVLIPSPGGGVGGGGANGGVIIVEVPQESTSRGTLTTVAHELVHALLVPRRSELTAAATRCGHALDAMTIGEGLAYAAAPGLFAYDDAVNGLERISANATKTSNASYMAFTRLGLALRPLLAERYRRASAGERGGLSELLDAACAASTK